MDTRLPLRSPAQPGCPLPVRPRLRAAMVRNHPASGLAAPGRGSQCGGGQSHHTFGPMLPMGPRSPLCPEHLQGTPQQAFSAMLSCQNGERSGPRPGLGRRRPRAVTAPVGSRCPRGESAVTPAQPGAVAQQAGSPPCGGSQAGHCRAAQVSNSDSRCPLRPGPLGKSPTLMFTLPMSHVTDAVPVPHGSTVRGAACRTAWTRPRGGWGVGCTRVSPPLSPGRHDPRHQTLGGPSHSLDLPVPSQPLASHGHAHPQNTRPPPSSRWAGDRSRPHSVPRHRASCQPVFTSPSSSSGKRRREGRSTVRSCRGARCPRPEQLPEAAPPLPNSS